MSFPMYPEMVDSGVEWLGKVPVHWGAWKLSHAFRKIGSGTTPSTANEDYYAGGDTPWVNTGDLNDSELFDCEKRISRLALEQHSTLKLYDEGSVVIAMYGATIGKLSILRFPATVNQACCVFDQGVSISSQFLFWSLLGHRNHILSLATGGGQPNINQEMLRALRLPCPSLLDQAAIASFLDRETSKIDNLIAEQKRLIDLLKEKRQAVISHAVTKGLNPDVPMKDSGIEGLGKIPEHWLIRRLKDVCGFKSAKAHEPYLDDDGQYVCVTARFVSTDGVAVKYCNKNLSPAQVGDILMVMSDLPNGRALARAYLVLDDGKFAVNQRVCIISPRGDDPSYLLYQLNRNRQLLQFDDGVEQTHLSNASFKQLLLALPPPKEQSAIAEYISVETSKLDDLITNSEQAVSLLQERRSALISAAVTGKIDVRGLNKPSEKFSKSHDNEKVVA